MDRRTGCQRDHHRIDPGMGSLGFKGLFISFIIFWLMNVYIAGSGSSAVQKLENMRLGTDRLKLYRYRMGNRSTADWSIGKLSEPSLQGDPTKNFWTLFFPALSSMIAFDGGIALSWQILRGTVRHRKHSLQDSFRSADHDSVHFPFVKESAEQRVRLHSMRRSGSRRFLVSKFEKSDHCCDLFHYLSLWQC